MKLLLLIVTLLFTLLLNAQSGIECGHHDYREGDIVFGWKFDGVKIRKEPKILSNVIGVVPEGGEVAILERLDTYSENNRCFNDTLLREPLIVFQSPFIKIKFGKTTGYVLEHYLNKMRPFTVEKLIAQGHPISSNRFVSPGDYSEAETGITVFDNGIICYTYFGGKVSYEQSFLIPYISPSNFQLYVLKMFAKYGSNKKEGVYFETDGTYFHWSITDPTGDSPGEESISIRMSPYGMIYSHEETGC